MSSTSQLTTFIYGLCDPLTQQLRYVGKSNNPAARLREHTREKSLAVKTHKNHWVSSLVAAGLKPEIFVIEEIDRSSWQEAEQFWIAYFRYLGASLTNGTEGGEGDCGPEGRVKQASAMRGRKAVRSHEHTEKLIEANKLRASDPGWRRKIKEAASNRAQRERTVLVERLQKAWFAPRTKRYDVACASCGENFIATNTRKKHCSPNCRRKYLKRAARRSATGDIA